MNRQAERTTIHIQVYPELMNQIREYAEKKQWSLNKACQNLVRIALENEHRND